MADDVSYYDLLGISPGATAEEVQHAFETKVELLGHTVAGAEQLVSVEEAFQVLADPALREEYDQRLQALEALAAFEEAEEEWLNSYHLQCGLLDPHQRDEVEHQLEDVFGLLASKSHEQVKAEVEQIFKAYRTQNCKGRLREEVMPYVRQLPAADQKPMLANILQSFGNIKLTGKPLPPLPTRL
eukprot:TRINITY_DN29548_c0_g1_i2.p1 TRINITY_DN29548_c0_g1~~TRINITY_DN29548_c0_g1_i2.p1  ORF type:complete len:185 (+),score=54.55 TRINITY_DN29548_c0_g1_i2:44-598(+)